MAMARPEELRRIAVCRSVGRLPTCLLVFLLFIPAVAAVAACQELEVPSRCAAACACTHTRACCACNLPPRRQSPRLRPRPPTCARWSGTPRWLPKKTRGAVGRWSSEVQGPHATIAPPPIPTPLPCTACRVPSAILLFCKLSHSQTHIFSVPHFMPPPKPLLAAAAAPGAPLPVRGRGPGG